MGLEVRALLFDCFGVLVTDTLVAFRDTYFANRPDFANELNDMTRAVDLGYLSKQKFHQRISEMNGMGVKEVYDVLERGSVLDESMMDLIRSLKPSYRIGMLSNISPSRLDDFFSENDRSLFDVLALSFEIGYVKPDQRGYEVALTRLGVLPEECIFIDDQLRNVEAARRAGMHAIHFRGQQDLQHELEKYGILTS